MIYVNWSLLPVEMHIYVYTTQGALISALRVGTEAISSTCWSGFLKMINVQLVVAADALT